MSRKAKGRSYQQKSGSDGKKFTLLAAVLLLVIGGIVVVAVVAMPGTEDDPCKSTTGDMPPEIIHECLSGSCQFDVTECPAPCPFGYESDGGLCEKSCECASEGVYQGDIRFESDEVMGLSEIYGYTEARSDFAVFAGSAAFGRQLWDTSIVNGRRKVYYELDFDMDKRVHEMVKVYSQTTCFDFLPRRNHETPYVKFVNGDGCSSFVGRGYSPEQTLSLKIPDCINDKTVQHELLHFLGFHHEHVRVDRDAYVSVNLDNVPEHYWRVFKKNKLTVSLGSEYDLASVSHYSPYAFAIDRSRPTIELINKGRPFPSNPTLSELDISELHTLYGCKGDYTRVDLKSQKKEWGAWEPWSGCNNLCGSGKRSRFRHCQDGHGKKVSGCIGAPKLSQGCEGTSCTAKGGSWGQWTTGACSVTCGSGVAWKKRSCPQRGTCSGQSNIASTCTKPQCGGGIGGDGQEREGRRGASTWGRWSAWSSCSKTCGTGSMARTRQCLRNGNTVSTSCAGDYRKTGKMTENKGCSTQGCYTQPGPDKGSSASWGQWNMWTKCSRTCSRGFRSRSRNCMIGSRSGASGCPGSSSRRNVETKYEPCNTQGCFTTQQPSTGSASGLSWGMWSRWLQCSASCGGGKKKRSKTCLRDGWPAAGQCPGDKTGNGVMLEVSNCNTQSCSVSPYGQSGSRGAAAWGSWGRWSSCSKTCGRGIKKRTRQCTKGGKKPVVGCPKDYGRSGIAEIWNLCNTEACGTLQTTAQPYTPQASSSWNNWGKWSACTKTCMSGRQTRERQCKGSFGRLAYNCAGDNQRRGTQSEYQTCNRQSCDRNTGSFFRPQGGSGQGVATWSEWGPWSTCSKSCGQGYWYRTRKCMKGGTKTTGCTGEWDDSGIQKGYSGCKVKECSGGYGR